MNFEKTPFKVSFSFCSVILKLNFVEIFYCNHLCLPTINKICILYWLLINLILQHEDSDSTIPDPDGDPFQTMHQFTVSEEGVRSCYKKATHGKLQFRPRHDSSTVYEGMHRRPCSDLGYYLQQVPSDRNRPRRLENSQRFCSVQERPAIRLSQLSPCLFDLPLL